MITLYPTSANGKIVLVNSQTRLSLLNSTLFYLLKMFLMIQPFQFELNEATV